MKCDVQAVTTFTLNLDLAAFSAIERALSFYRDRAILQDGDPASDLSRQFTSLLMKMRNSQKPKLLLEEAPDLPGPQETPPDEVQGVSALSEAQTPPVPSQDVPESNPLEQALEDMIGGQ